VAALITARAGLAWWLGFRPFDDTYITLRFAQNLISGSGFSYNSGEPVLVVTTPMWALLVAAGGALGVPLESVAFALGLAADAAVVWLLWSLIRVLGFGEHAAVMGVVMFAALTDAWSLARSGMEVSAFALCALVALRCALANRMVVAWGVAAIAVLVRPEGILIFPALLAIVWASRPRLQIPWQAVGVAAGIGAVWGIGAWWYFGSPIPQSLVAKAAHVTAAPDLCGFSAANLRQLVTTGQFGDLIFSRSWLQLAWLPWLCAVIGLIRMRRTWPALATLAVFPLLYGVVYASRCAFTWFPWYYYAFYPFVCALAGIGLAGVWRRSRLFASAVVALWVVAQTTAFVTHKHPASDDFIVRGYTQVTVPVPRSPDVVVAALEIGVVGWRVYPSRILDLAGLASPEVIGVPQTEAVARTQPDYLVLRTDDAAALLSALRATAWFSRDYVPMITLPDPAGGREFVTWRRVRTQTGIPPRAP
jgi:hypothetical protein